MTAQLKGNVRYGNKPQRREIVVLKEEANGTAMPCLGNALSGIGCPLFRKPSAQRCALCGSVQPQRQSDSALHVTTRCRDTQQGDGI